MKVLYDHQIFSYQEYGGVTRYFYEIINRLPKEQWNISCNLSNNYLFGELAKKKNIRFAPFLKNYKFRRKGRLMIELGKFHSLAIIRKNDYDILHLTHYESYAVRRTSKPIVITYHDKLFSSYAYSKHTVKQQKKCLKKADAVICISENTKKDFLSLFDYPEEKVHVIYHGINTLPYISEPRKINYNYILFVGGRSGYKNFENLAKAFSELRKDYKNLHLICTGKQFDENEITLLKDLNIYDCTSAKFVSDYELAELYTFAECFVFPSKYEGFGMPLLEAMDHNCPVCCSDAHCFPEIVGDAALLFNPDDINDIRNKINSVLVDEKLRNDLIEKGKVRKNMFSWEKSVEQHLKLYESLLEEKKNE